jgi:DNA-binding transcriptional regulator YiaG
MSKRVLFFIKGKAKRAKPYRYVASGLDNIFLLNGVSTDNTSYGPMVTIDNLNGLHRAIGLHIVEKPEPITGAEFRFLRKQMQLTQRQLAGLMQLSDQTVANYEKGNTKELGAADPLMRIQYLLHIVPDETRAAILRAVADGTGRQRGKLPEIPRRKLVQRWHEGQREAA